MTSKKRFELARNYIKYLEFKVKSLESLVEAMNLEAQTRRIARDLNEMFQKLETEDQYFDFEKFDLVKRKEK